MKDVLHILYGEVAVGSLIYDRKKDEISMTYEELWQFGQESFPVSLSLPLAKKAHSDERIRPFLQGLLPDNPAVIEAWGKRFQVSPRNPFDIIKHVGEDCAGALQFIRPERLDLILSGKLDSLTPLTDEDLAKRMIDLKSQARSIPTQIEGRFSLAGAQTKDALHLKDGLWHVPGGRIPSTHILKPQLDEFEEHALNEHFCLKLAGVLGLACPKTDIMEIGGAKVLSVQRYDRVEGGNGKTHRIHQEDACQALGFYPNQKYQADGGPSAAEIIKLLTRYSDDPVDDFGNFIKALIFNWVIAGTDAHSKNYSILHTPGSYVRLAPLYDMASYLPYVKDPKSTKVKLAMKIGSSYRLHQIDTNDWRKWAVEADLDPEGVVGLTRKTVQRILEFTRKTQEDVARTLHSLFLQTLADAIIRRAEKCSELLG